MATRPRPPVSAEVFYARAFSLLTVGVLGLLIYRILMPIFPAIAWAVLIAFLLHPIHKRFSRLLRGHSNVSAGMLTAATIVIVLGPLTGLAAAFVNQAGEMLELFQRLTAQQQAGGASGIENRLYWVQRTLGVAPAQLREWISEGSKAALQAMAAMGGKLFVGALGTALTFTVSMFVLFFLLRDGARMVETVRGLIPMSGPNKQRLFDHLGSVVQAVIYGTGLTALIQGALLGVGFAVLGLPAPVVFGVIGVILSLLPLVGTPLVWVPAVIFLVLQGRWGAAIALLVWGLLVSTVDNVLRPILVSGRAQIGALTVFIGVIGGVTAFGTSGLILGPVTLSLGLAIVRFTLELRELQAGKRPSQPLPSAQSGQRPDA